MIRTVSQNLQDAKKISIETDDLLWLVCSLLP